jgi:hypothetical protein
MPLSESDEALRGIDVGCSAGLSLNVDRVGITHSNGQSLDDPSPPVQLSCSIVRGRPVPTRAMPEVRLPIDEFPGNRRQTVRRSGVPSGFKRPWRQDDTSRLT